MSGKDALNLAVGSLFQQRWKIESKLGQGGFGAVYKVEDSTRPGKFYALKIERTNIANSVLKMDTIVLLKMQRNKHICKFQACGRDEHINFLVMALAGANLEGLFDKSSNRKFSLSTTLQIGVQAVEALKDLHDAGFLHRDVKPANFALGRDAHARVVKLLDFGLARQYLTKDGGIRPPRKTLGFRGTERYASINAHAYKELGRHDDIISLFYMLVEFLNGSLPWKEEDDFEVVGEKKENVLTNAWKKSLAKQLLEIYENLLGLRYFDTPDYQWIIDKCENLAKENNLTLQEPFDWESQEKPGTSGAAPGSGKGAEYPYERQFHGEKSIKNRNRNENDDEPEQ